MRWLFVKDGTSVNDAVCKIKPVAVDVLSNEWYNRNTKKKAYR